MRHHSKAFTLIELMIVAAIVGMLTAIAIPKFANLTTKSREAAVRGKLAVLRSAISIYYSDNEGRFPVIGISPQVFPNILTPKYVDKFPSITIPNTTHPESNDCIPPISFGEWSSVMGERRGVRIPR